MHIALVYLVRTRCQYLITLSNRFYFKPNSLLKLNGLAVYFLLELADNSLDLLLHSFNLIGIQSLFLACHLYFFVDVLECLPKMGAMIGQALTAQKRKFPALSLAADELLGKVVFFAVLDFGCFGGLQLLGAIIFVDHFIIISIGNEGRLIVG